MLSHYFGFIVFAFPELLLLVRHDSLGACWDIRIEVSRFGILIILILHFELRYAIIWKIVGGWIYLRCIIITVVTVLY